MTPRPPTTPARDGTGAGHYRRGRGTHHPARRHPAHHLHRQVRPLMSKGRKRHTRKVRHRDAARLKHGSSAVRSHKRIAGRTGAIFRKKIGQA